MSRYKYMMNLTFDDLEWVMHTFQRRCDVQSVPEYANVMMDGRVQSVALKRNTFVIVQNDKDNVFFKLRFPDSVLVEQTITSD